MHEAKYSFGSVDKMADTNREGIIAFEDGTVFRGRAFGATATSVGEACFNTSMTGYQEILTDPSYFSQIVTMTAVQIGNYGINTEDVESDGPKVKGFVVREVSPITSNWRSSTSVQEYLQIAGIPGLEGVEVFPSIEVINRIYPPRGLEAKFAIPIQLSLREIKMAVQGFYVTRVIYLEDPTNPIPVDEPIGRQRTLDISYTEDPLHVADKLGRPVAILRIGSRYPQLNAQTARFMFSSPPIQIIATPLLPAANTSASTTPAGFTTSASTNVAPITRAAARPVSFPIPR